MSDSNKAVLSLIIGIILCLFCENNMWLFPIILSCLAYSAYLSEYGKKDDNEPPDVPFSSLT